MLEELENGINKIFLDPKIKTNNLLTLYLLSNLIENYEIFDYDMYNDIGIEFILDKLKKKREFRVDDVKIAYITNKNKLILSLKFLEPINIIEDIIENKYHEETGIIYNKFYTLEEIQYLFNHFYIAEENINYFIKDKVYQKDTYIIKGEVLYKNFHNIFGLCKNNKYIFLNNEIYYTIDKYSNIMDVEFYKYFCINSSKFYVIDSVEILDYKVKIFKSQNGTKYYCHNDILELLDIRKNYLTYDLLINFSKQPKYIKEDLLSIIDLLYDDVIEEKSNIFIYKTKGIILEEISMNLPNILDKCKIIDLIQHVLNKTDITKYTIEYILEKYTCFSLFKHEIKKHLVISKNQKYITKENLMDILEKIKN